MRSAVGSAPGKVILAGEYAVLDGAPAIVMALDRRARVTAARSDNDWHRLAAPGLMDGYCEFRATAGGGVAFRRPGAQIDLALVARVLNATGADAGRPLTLELDTGAFFHPLRRTKFGLGSSAALAVALSAALLRLANDTRHPGEPALAAHRAFQGGRGSGADIAAAVHGGVLAWRAAGEKPATPLQWPAGLCWGLMWSGRASSTAGKIARYRESLRGRSERSAAKALRTAAERVLESWPLGGDAILGELRDYAACLSAFSAEHDLGVFDAGHRELHELAAACQLVYKPCGAGGGDVGIALAKREADLMEFTKRAMHRGFERLDVAVDPCGVEAASVS